MINWLAAILAEAGSVIVLSATVGTEAHAMDVSGFEVEGDRANLKSPKNRVNTTQIDVAH